MKEEISQHIHIDLSDVPPQHLMRFLVRDKLSKYNKIDIKNILKNKPKSIEFRSFDRKG